MESIPSLGLTPEVSSSLSPFQVEIDDNNTLSDLQMKIKLECPSHLPQEAGTLNLYKAPIGVRFTEPGVTVGTKDEVKTISSLCGIIMDVNRIHVIVQPPSYKRSPLNVVQYNRRSGNLVWKDDTFKSFPVGHISNFKTLRQRPDLCYFDKTAFISAIESVCCDALVFLRPRRSGKSLALSTLAHFHGREHLPDYDPLFKGLDIDEHVTKNCVSPGQYFVLQLDFSAATRTPDMDDTLHNLSVMLNESIKRFYRTYEPYLRESADYLIEKLIRSNPLASMSACVNVVHNLLRTISDLNDPLSKIKGIYIMADEYDNFSYEYLAPVDNVQSKPSRRSNPSSLLRGFWALVKSELGDHKIAKCYMTGVSPQSMDGYTPGFNVDRSVSWDKDLAGLCGLTKADVAAALEMEQVCWSTVEAGKHLKTMTDHYSGLNFVPGEQRPLTYDTNASLEYLQAEHIARDRAVWLSFMLHLGELTFCVGKKGLRITNLVAAARLGCAILDRHHANLEDVNDAFKALIDNGYIDKIIGLYARGMKQNDVGRRDFQMTGENHCNLMRSIFLANIHPSFRKFGVETTITKPAGTPGRIGMLVSVPLRKQLFVLEWKSIQIYMIKIGSGSQSVEADALAKIHDATHVLNLKFRYRESSQSIKDWILSGPKVGEVQSPQQQLHEYAQSPEIERWKMDGYTITPVLVVVVGSRQILLWNLDGFSLDKSPRLAF
ncbi:hypothetical protein BGX20_002585 [Mortierella sp. AD010]|nr:hypothetical protein BGX20_002585 [Mortierella sp. AD010]